jgi:predicted Zn-dependent protease
MKWSITVLVFFVLALGSTGAEVSSNVTNFVRLMHESKFAEARKIYDTRLTDEEKKDQDIQIIHIRFLLASGQFDTARKTISSYLQSFPKDYRACFLLGKTLVQAGNTREGLPLLRRSIELNPNHAPSYFSLAAGLGFDKERVAALNKVLFLEEHDSPLAKQALKLLQEDEERMAAQQPDAGD